MQFVTRNSDNPICVNNKLWKQGRLKLNYCIFLKCRYYITNYCGTILGIIKVIPSSIQLYYEGKIMDGTKTLYDCGLNSFTANVMRPATIGLTLK